MFDLFLAVHATTDATSGSTQKTLSKMGLVKDAAGVVADDTLNKERTTNDALVPEVANECS